MRQGRKRRKIVICLLCSVLLLMTVGYAAFQTQFSIKGNTKITSNWDIRITNVTETNKTGSGESTNPPTWTNLTANMEADLYEKGDSVEYDITIENKGTLDAKLENIITNVKSNNEAIKISFSGYAKGEKLFKNESKIIKAKIEYNSDFNGKAEGSGEVEIVFNYTQAEGGTITLKTVYRWTTDRLYIGDSIEEIETTTDPTTLGKNHFLKHEIVNNKIQTSEVCFIKDGNIHCLKPNEYETSKAKMLEIFGESACRVSDSQVICTPLGVSANVLLGGDVGAGVGSSECSVISNGLSRCGVAE